MQHRYGVEPIPQPRRLLEEKKNDAVEKAHFMRARKGDEQEQGGAAHFDAQKMSCVPPFFNREYDERRPFGNYYV
jgi:hypothetical protein